MRLLAPARLVTAHIHLRGLTMGRASTGKRARAASTSSLSATDTESAPVPTKRGSRAAKPSSASSRALGKTASTSSRKSIKWPPADLDAPYPARAGYPPFQFPTPAPKVTTEHGGNGVNGGIPPLPTGPLLLGAHVSAAGGQATALLRARKLGANGLALFVKGHRTFKAKDLEEDAIERFRELLKPEDQGGSGYSAQDILVHGNYLVNLGNPDPKKWHTAYACFRDDIERCYKLGIKLYNWHPGSTVGACSKDESFKLVAKAINMVHKDVPEVITVIENMANAGSNILGTAWSELAAMIALVDDKSRVRVCIDTCHTFAAGYDIRTAESYGATMESFGEEVGFEYLAGIHLNDSKAELGAHRDLHENIGLGHIGLTGFRCLMRDPRMQGIPLVLETPSGPDEKAQPVSPIWAKEIALLYEIQGIPDSEWEGKKDDIEQRWRKERDAIAPPKDKKVKATASKGRKKAKKQSESEESD